MDKEIQRPGTLPRARGSTLKLWVPKGYNLLWNVP